MTKFKKALCLAAIDREGLWISPGFVFDVNEKYYSDSVDKIKDILLSDEFATFLAKCLYARKDTLDIEIGDYCITVKFKNMAYEPSKIRLRYNTVFMYVEGEK